jgi:hypothetical protein
MGMLAPPGPGTLLDGEDRDRRNSTATTDGEEIVAGGVGDVLSKHAPERLERIAVVAFIIRALACS